MAERGSDKHGPRLDDDLHDAASLDLDDAEARADLARFLNPSTFPADREALLADATGNQASAQVVERIQALPAGRTFQNVQEVWVALGGMVEHRF
jgi:hypothetical protein